MMYGDLFRSKGAVLEITGKTVVLGRCFAASSLFPYVIIQGNAMQHNRQYTNSKRYRHIHTYRIQISELSPKSESDGETTRSTDERKILQLPRPELK